MKKAVITAAIATCLAPCAAVWPQAEAVEKIPTPISQPVVSVQKETVAELQTEVETTPPAEKEKVETPQEGSSQEVLHEREPAPIEAPTTPEIQPTPEAEPTAEFTPEPSPTQTPITPHPVTWSTWRDSAG